MSDNGTTSGLNSTSAESDNELGMNPDEPYLNPNPNKGFLLVGRKWYTRDGTGKLIRHYPAKATLP